MASHFVRWLGNPLLSSKLMRIPQDVINSAEHFPDKRRSRFLAARELLAQLMLRVYGIRELPALITTSSGRPCFTDPHLPDFSIAYAGNTIGVLLAEKGGRASLDMEIVHAHSRQVTQIWTLRQSILKLTGETESGMMR